MTLDAKSQEWASENGIDTKTLKAASIPIYGKWYFPEIPAGVPLVNLKTGEIQSFGPGLRAGEVLFVARADLRREKLGPYARAPESAGPALESPESAVAVALPSRPVAVDSPETSPVVLPAVAPPGLRLASPSVFPLIVCLGIAITLVGLVVGPRPPDPGWVIRPIIAALGLLYVIVGGVGWVSQGWRERDA